MQLLQIVAICLLFLIIAAVADLFNGSSAYIGWGLAAAAGVLILYMVLRR